MIKQGKPINWCIKRTEKYRFWAPLKYRFWDGPYGTQIFHVKYRTRPLNTEQLSALHGPNFPWFPLGWKVKWLENQSQITSQFLSGNPSLISYSTMWAATDFLRSVLFTCLKSVFVVMYVVLILLWPNDRAVVVSDNWPGRVKNTSWVTFTDTDQL